MHLPAMSIFDDSFIPAASVSEFCCVDPQQRRFAPVQPWQLPYPPFAVPSGHMLAPVPRFSPQMQRSLPVDAANCSDCWDRMNASFLRFDSALPDFVPPVDPEILVRFMFSPDYSCM